MYLLIAIVIVVFVWRVAHTGNIRENLDIRVLNLAGTEASSDEIVVISPESDDKAISPLVVRGRARGSWYFEASAPIAIYDTQGNVLGRSFVMAQGEWMTSDFVNFEGKIEFEDVGVERGFLVFMNDNPSGEASRAKYVALPVYFK